MLFVRGVYILVSTRLREGVKWTCADCSNCANKNESAIQLRAGELHDMCGSSHSGSQYSLSRSIWSQPQTGKNTLPYCFYSSRHDPTLR